MLNNDTAEKVEHSLEALCYLIIVMLDYEVEFIFILFYNLELISLSCLAFFVPDIDWIFARLHNNKLPKT